MVDYGRVRSTVKPQPVVIDEFSVWKHTDIQEVSENPGAENEFNGYEYNMVQYSKDEYIRMVAEENTTLGEQMTDLQMALCDVYEMME